MDNLDLKIALLCEGLKMDNNKFPGRKVGAGPAGWTVEIEDFSVNIPFIEDHQVGAPSLSFKKENSFAIDYKNKLIDIRLIPRPQFYNKRTNDGIPMKKIALLHGPDCLATTIYQDCIFHKMDKACSFCAIRSSLTDRRTSLIKTPDQLLEVALESQKDGIKHITLTTGTPDLVDHGAINLAEAVKKLKNNIDLPIHVQVTPTSEKYLELLYKSGADSIGIHIESFDPYVMARTCPGKKDFDYQKALKFAVTLFGENQVSSFIIGGLGENPWFMVKGFEDLSSEGVIPFLVPFRPLPGTSMKDHNLPDTGYMKNLYAILVESIKKYGLDINDNKAGCVRCGACSALDMALRYRN